jgi:ABC-type dipeptide/oligopeptide/nickel transport system permease subunit
MRNQLFFKLMRSKFFIIGSIISLAIIILALIAPLIVAYSPRIPNLPMRLKAPEFLSHGWKGHILGTDAMGQDIFTRILMGSRYSLAIAIVSVAVSAFFGTIAGLIAGYYGRWVDNIIMRFGDIQLSIPVMLLAISIVAILGPNLINLTIVMIITSWVQYARVIRGNTLVIRQSEFISASRVLGATDGWIMLRQILPNVLTPIVIICSQQVGYMILLEAGLSFLGLGVQPPAPSWGVMIADGRNYIQSAPWTVLAPGIVLMITVLGFNFLGDGLRDALDPKMKM